MWATFDMANQGVHCLSIGIPLCRRCAVCSVPGQHDSMTAIVISYHHTVLMLPNSNLQLDIASHAVPRNSSTVLKHCRCAALDVGLQ